jgi:hypothetical protein
MDVERVKILMTVVKNGLASHSADGKSICLEIIKELLPETNNYCDELYKMKQTARDGIASKDINYKHICLEIIQAQLYY